MAKKAGRDRGGGAGEDGSSDGGGRPIAFVMLSGIYGPPGTEAREQCRSKGAGVFGYLVKPFRASRISWPAIATRPPGGGAGVP